MLALCLIVVNGYLLPCNNQVIKVTEEIEHMGCFPSDTDYNQEGVLLSKYINNIAGLQKLSFSGWYNLLGSGYSGIYNTIFSVMRKEPANNQYYRNFAVQYFVSTTYRYIGMEQCNNAAAG